MAAPKKYPDELRARAVRLYRESEPRPVIRKLAEQLGVHHEALQNWIRQDKADRGQRDDRPTTEMNEENRRLRRENAELRRINEVLKAASAFSPRSATRPGVGREVRRRTSWPLRGRTPATGPGHQRVDLLRLGPPGRAAV
ncbi:transposase [Actinoplanes sp. NPDC051346]|uniref:transposase n=1 Tax=Actinoplanes sp. NPDC051346 TaxID=3155048 RepID=UPI003433850B